MAEAQRLLLACEARLAGAGEVLFEKIEFGRLAALPERRFELVLLVEVVLDDALVAARHEDEMLDARLAGLVDGELDDRPIHHGEHFLGHGLGGGQEARSQPCDGKHRGLDRLNHLFTFH